MPLKTPPASTNQTGKAGVVGPHIPNPNTPPLPKGYGGGKLNK